MITDIRTVIWKEWKEYLLQYGSLRKAILNLLMLVGLLGIFLPLQTGRAWLESWVPLYWIWIPILLVITVTADSIAGERERHTLETLLASRLPDRAILFGKIVAAVLYGCGLLLLGLLLGWLTVNIVYWDGRLSFYRAPVFLSIILVSLLGTLLVAMLGALVSIRAATVRQAYQTLVIPLMLIALLPSAVLLLPADLQTRLFTALFKGDVSGAIALVGALILALADAVLLGMVMARFRRTRLVLL